MSRDHKITSLYSPRFMMLAAALSAWFMACPSNRAMADDADALPDHASPSACVVIMRLALQANAVSAAQVDSVETAADAYRQKSIELNGSSEAADQMIASTVSFFDELSPQDLTRGTDMCMASVNAQFTDDE